MNRKLSAQQVQRYREDGILFPITAFDPAESAAFLQEFNRMEQYEGPQKYAPHPHLFFPWAYALATHPGLVEVVEAIIGPDVLVEGTVILAKYPADGSFAPWHQDGEYSGWYKTPSVTAWIALTESHRNNGCMRVIAGSQRAGRRPHRDVNYQGSLFRRGTEIAVEVDETLATDVELKAGELSLHDSSIIHGSSPNRCDTRRVGFVVRFVTPAFQSRIHQHPVVRAHGVAGCGVLPVLTAPPAGELEECFTRWREAFPV
ncbi:MAG TPA: phytanoyl-CoA dioxygenase family protein [Candidatus Angelobacter sp.]|nr:phytanoyl-CoA dioxygenase family protein [Candidatus Angelobacter sp.]